MKKRAFRFTNDMTYSDLAAYASSTAFFFFIAIIPLLILLSALLPLTGIDEEQVIEMVTGYTPTMTDSFVTRIIRQAFDAASGIVPLSFVVLLYSVARGMLTLIRGLNRIYDIKEKRNGFVLQLVALFYTTLLVVALTLSLVLIVFGDTIMNFLEEHITILTKVPFVIYSIRYLLVIAIGVGIFMLIYAFVPGIRQPFLKQFPGALFSAIGWGVFSYFFSIFIGSNSIYGTYYGSLAAIAVLMMWLYGCFYILLIGAVLNRALSWRI